jgi:peptidoglycan/xylan/chitin deacetylase (PgdA/CDA1 family)
MLHDQDLRGADLPPRTICLTYDDGPGPHTRELGEFLFEQGVPATFFVVGREAQRHGALLGRLTAWGHRLGNHTWSHAGLVDLALAGGDVVEEVARCDAVLRPHVRGPVLMRPPYGSWRERTRPDGPEDAPTSIVAERLRQSGRFDDYVGPVGWDVVAKDWECWGQGIGVEECARRHLEEIERAGRGIVLLHDSSEDESLRPRNRTAEMTRLLVPRLKVLGYRFAGLEEVPQVRAELSFRGKSGGTTVNLVFYFPPRWLADRQVLAFDASADGVRFVCMLPAEELCRRWGARAGPDEAEAMRAFTANRDDIEQAVREQVERHGLPPETAEGRVLYLDGAVTGR